MSSVKLLLSGSLVASGLILGAFTLHGAFGPHWAAGRHDSAVNAFQTTTRFAPRKAKSTDAKRRPSARAAARKGPAPRRTGKSEAGEQPQQATLQWPLWDWFAK